MDRWTGRVCGPAERRQGVRRRSWPARHGLWQAWIGVDGTPEVADIGMMQSKSLTYTFGGSGRFAYACHAPGHYEAGMKGTIAVVG
jgi:FtsP/CotA-like multicopper oxidase with cupredoxin domain